MKGIRLDKNVNAELLDIELRRALGSSYIGLSTVGEYAVAYLCSDLDDAALRLAREIIADHDPDIPSPRQRLETRWGKIRERLGAKSFSAMSEAERMEALQVLLEVNGLALPPESEG